MCVSLKISANVRTTERDGITCCERVEQLFPGAPLAVSGGKHNVSTINVR